MLLITRQTKPPTSETSEQKMSFKKDKKHNRRVAFALCRAAKVQITPAEASQWARESGPYLLPGLAPARVRDALLERGAVAYDIINGYLYARESRAIVDRYRLRRLENRIQGVTGFARGMVKRATRALRLSGEKGSPAHSLVLHAQDCLTHAETLAHKGLLYSAETNAREAVFTARAALRALREE